MVRCHHGQETARAEPTPGRELQLPRLGCQTRETLLSKYSYRLLWLSGSKPSKLCRYICKALRGNNGQNLKTEENFLRRWTTHAWPTVAHTDNHVVHAYVIITTLCNHIEKKEEQINLLVLEKKFSS